MVPLSTLSVNVVSFICKGNTNRLNSSVKEALHLAPPLVVFDKSGAVRFLSALLGRAFVGRQNLPLRHSGLLFLNTKLENAFSKCHRLWLNNNTNKNQYTSFTQQELWFLCVYALKGRKSREFTLFSYVL